MKKKLILVKIDKKYCDYLRKYDNKVPFNYDKKENRPFAPLSSPKAKHLKLVNKIDFLKIDHGKLGAINFNNMIPVTEDNIVKIDLNQKLKDKDEKKYLKLLNEQIYWLNRNSNLIYNKSINLYNKYNDGSLNKNVMLRCCNFKLLEEKCLKYNNKSKIKS